MISLEGVGALIAEASSAWLGILMEATLKGLVVLIVAILVVWRLSSASAALRHLVWLLAATALLLLPILCAVLPGWAGLPSWASSALPSAERFEARGSNSPDDLEQLGEDSSERLTGVQQWEETAIGSLSIVANDGMARAELRAAAPSLRATGHRWQVWIALGWLAGALIGMTPRVAGVLSLHRVARSADVVCGGPLVTALGRAAAEMGVRRRVTLLVSRSRAIPMQWGIARPRILVPVDALYWPPERLRVVFLHELGHVRRNDCLTQFVAHLVSAVYWFNPLVWLARQRMQVEAEAACDDLVLRAGCGSLEYARHLVEIACGVSPGALAGHVAIAFSRSARLEGRVRAILNPRRNHCALTRLTIGAALAGLLVLLVPLAMLRAASRTRPAATVLTGAAEATPEAGSLKAGPAEPGKHADHVLQGQQPAPPQQKKSERVRQAVTRGVEFLKGQQRHDGSWPEYPSQPGGITALSALALVRSGVGANEAAIRKAVEYLRQQEGEGGRGVRGRTYSVALETMLLSALDRQAHAEAIRRNVQWLEQAQRNGGWSYDIRGGEMDHSNTHFALMALDAADKAGVPVESKTWRASLEHWIKVQNPDGSWGYKAAASGTGSMTCAGISSVAISTARISMEEDRAKQARTAIENADQWMSRNFAVDKNPGSRISTWGLYYLHTLSRAGQDAKRARIGRHDWHREISDFLADSQRGPNGHWSGRGPIESDPRIATSFALLCLAAEPGAQTTPGPPRP